jgi:hypothetical protein
MVNKKNYKKWKLTSTNIFDETEYKKNSEKEFLWNGEI